MASIGAIFTSTYHTKQPNPWPNSSASCVVNYSWLSACQGHVEPFEGDPSTCGCLTSLRNKPQQSSQGNFQHQYMPQLLVNVYSYRLMVKKCVLLLCAWKASFLKSGHIYVCINVMYIYMYHTYMKYIARYQLGYHKAYILCYNQY